MASRKPSYDEVRFVDDGSGAARTGSGGTALDEITAGTRGMTSKGRDW